MDEEEWEERRRERRCQEKERRKALGGMDLAGIDARYVCRTRHHQPDSNINSAWDEIYEVFRDGHKYDWALVDDEEPGYDNEASKQETKYQDVRILFSLDWRSFAHSSLGFRFVRNQGSYAPSSSRRKAVIESDEEDWTRMTSNYLVYRIFVISGTANER